PKSESNRINFLSHKLFLGRFRGPLLIFFRRCRFCSGLPCFLFLLAFRFLSLASLNCYVVRQNDPDMARPFLYLAAAATSARRHSFVSWCLALFRFLFCLIVCFQVMFVFLIFVFC